jgi:cytochrome b involved in lipid metabolism
MWYAPYLAISLKRLINRRIQWIIVDSRVYDVSKFADLHPGGAAVLLVDSIGIDPFPPP